MNGKCMDCGMPCPEGDYYCEDCLSDPSFYYEDDIDDWNDYWDEPNIAIDEVNDWW